MDILTGEVLVNSILKYRQPRELFKNNRKSKKHQAVRSRNALNAENNDTKESHLLEERFVGGGNVQDGVDAQKVRQEETDITTDEYRCVGLLKPLRIPIKPKQCLNWFCCCAFDLFQLGLHMNYLFFLFHYTNKHNIISTTTFYCTFLPVPWNTSSLVAFTSACVLLRRIGEEHSLKRRQAWDKLLDMPLETNPNPHP